MFFAARSETSKLFGLITLAVLALPIANTPGKAGFIVTLEQDGSDVVATGSGAIDLTGLRFLFTSLGGTEIFPSRGAITTGPGDVMVDVYHDGLTGPTSFGSGMFTPASSGSGAHVGIDDSPPRPLVVPQGYVSGDPLSGTSTFAGQTFASLGVTSGTYEWTWGNGPDQNLTLQIGPAAVPEPTSLTLFASALLGFGIVRRRDKRGMQG
jgi:hypothetical protein